MQKRGKDKSSWKTGRGYCERDVATQPDQQQEKEPTDINELADEYLRLAYHGLRAKDKSFNADFKTDLDEGLPKIKVVAQDIGRVLLNLINNAFYAVSEASAKEDKDTNQR